jgi:hypothetical protein
MRGCFPCALRPRETRADPDECESIPNENEEGKPLRVMLLGSRIELKPSSSAHKFWLGMIPAIGDSVKQFVIASIGGKTSQNEYALPEARAFPFPLRLIYAGNPEGNVTLETNFFLKTALFGGVFPLVAELVKKCRIDLIHLVDNYGPIQALLSRVRAAKTSFQLNYNPKSLLYNEFLRASLGSMDGVVTGLVALARKLGELRVTPRIVTIPWAVSVDSQGSETGDNVDPAALGLKVPPERTLVTWTGFLGEFISKQELLFSIRIAKQVLRELRDVSFAFTLKNEHFDREYKSFEEDRIKILSLRSRTEFLKLARLSSLLFSACLNERIIIGPPLTWLECMAIGVPIVTTKLQGVDELILDGSNGIIVPSPEQAHEHLSQLLRDGRKMKRLATNAKETVKTRFEMKNVAAEYVRGWSSIVNSRRSNTNP